MRPSVAAARSLGAERGRVNAPAAEEDAVIPISALRSEDSASRLNGGDLARSYAACRRVTRAANSSFPLAFLVLPRPKRRAMDALYAFMRVTDDLADDPGDTSVKRGQLREWRAALRAAVEGGPPPTGDPRRRGAAGAARTSSAATGCRPSTWRRSSTA